MQPLFSTVGMSSNSTVGTYSGKMTFSTSNQLESAFNEISRLAQNRTLEKMKAELDRIIWKDLYNFNTARSAKYKWTDVAYLKTKSPNADSYNSIDKYIRTKNMLSIFQIRKAYNSHGRVYGSIYIDNHKLIINQMEFQHSSPPRYKGSQRLGAEGYVHIINEGLSEEHSMFGEIEPRPFWDEFNEWARNNYKKIYESEFRVIVRFCQLTGHMPSN